MDFVPDTLGPHDIVLAHDRQMLADLRLAFSSRLGQVLDCMWPLSKPGEEFQTCRLSQDPAEVCLQPIQSLFSLAFPFLASFRCSLVEHFLRIPAELKPVYENLSGVHRRASDSAEPGEDTATQEREGHHNGWPSRSPEEGGMPQTSPCGTMCQYARLKSCFSIW